MIQKLQERSNDRITVSIKKPSRFQMFTASLVLVNILAIAGSVYGSTALVEKGTITKEEYITASVDVAISDPLLRSLGSDELVKDLIESKNRKAEENLANSELKLAEAEKILSEAKSQARQIQIDASVAGADGVKLMEEDAPIILGYPVRISHVKSTPLGYTVTAYPTTDEGSVRTFVNLKVAAESEEFKPKQPIGFASGDVPVAEFVRHVLP